jgi:hypothetical protein
MINILKKRNNTLNKSNLNNLLSKSNNFNSNNLKLKISQIEIKANINNK